MKIWENENNRIVNLLDGVAVNAVVTLQSGKVTVELSSGIAITETMPDAQVAFTKEVVSAVLKWGTVTIVEGRIAT